MENGILNRDLPILILQNTDDDCLDVLVYIFFFCSSGNSSLLMLVGCLVEKTFATGDVKNIWCVLKSFFVAFCSIFVSLLLFRIPRRCIYVSPNNFPLFVENRQLSEDTHLH